MSKKEERELYEVERKRDLIISKSIYSDKGNSIDYTTKIQHIRDELKNIIEIQTNNHLPIRANLTFGEMLGLMRR